MAGQSRRRDTVTERATSELALQQLGAFLQQIVDDLSPREAGVIRLRFGLTDGFPRTLDEIGQTYGVTRERIREIERKTIQKLANRHGYNDTVRDLLASEYSGLPPHVEERALGRPRRRSYYDDLFTEFFCPRHQVKHLLGPGNSRCLHCSCIAPSSTTGRPRRYCSNACRQAAYRRRNN